MDKINIEQSQQLNEQVSPEVVDKLYKYALQSKVENEYNTLEMTLSGQISTKAAYDNAVEYLREKFPNLIINPQVLYIYFEDKNVEQVCIIRIYWSYSRCIFL